MGNARTDEELMLSLVAGDDDSAWAELSARYREPLLCFCMSYLKDAHTAEDLAHDVLIRIYQRRDTYKSGSKFTPWLYRIARNLCLDLLRRRGIEVSGWANHSSVGIFVERLADSRTGPDGKAMRNDMVEAIRSSLESLDEPTRMALVLRHGNGFSVQEVADALGIQRDAAKMRLYRGMKGLREAIAPIMDGHTGEVKSVHPPSRS